MAPACSACAPTDSSQQLTWGPCRTRSPMKPQGQAFCYPPGCSRLLDDTCHSHPKLHRHQELTAKPPHPTPVWLTAVQPALATPPMLEPGSGLLGHLRPQTQKDAQGGRSNTRHAELCCPNHRDPSASDGQQQTDGSPALSFRIFMPASNLSFQVHRTISKSDIQCSQTVHL